MKMNQKGKTGDFRISDTGWAVCSGTAKSGYCEAGIKDFNK